MLSFDVSDFERRAAQMGAALDQVPFALAGTLTTAAFTTRRVLTDETWPQHVQVRDRNFIRNALRVDPARKSDLTVAITNQGTSAGGRAHLKLHAKGGAKQARGRLAIPDRKILNRRSGKGMPANLRPGTAPNVFRRGDVLYQVQGKGKRARLRLLYTLKPSAAIKATVPFQSDFAESMRREMHRAFGPAMTRAMRTRR